jgi:hypothetical protein
VRRSQEDNSKEQPTVLGCATNLPHAITKEGGSGRLKWAGKAVRIDGSGNRSWRCERKVVSSEQVDRQGKDRGFGRHRSPQSGYFELIQSLLELVGMSYDGMDASAICLRSLAQA